MLSSSVHCTVQARAFFCWPQIFKSDFNIWSPVLSMITLCRLGGTSLQANVSTLGGLCKACPVARGMASQLALPPNHPTGRRGAFIVLEGADRAGKSTQCKLLVQQLQALGVRLPRSESLKAKLRQLLNGASSQRPTCWTRAISLNGSCLYSIMTNEKGLVVFARPSSRGSMAVSNVVVGYFPTPSL